MNVLLAGFTPTLHLSTELFILLGGTLMMLLPTLAVIYCIRLNPYLETIASYGTRFVVCDIRAWSFT